MKSADIRQSAEFAAFMSDIGWKYSQVSGNYVYLRKFPIIGNFAKCPRPTLPLEFSEIRALIKKKRIFNFKLAPNLSTDNKIYKYEKNKYLKSGFKIDIEPFNPTTTIIVDLVPSENEIFKKFSEAKRRGVRRALKNGVTVSKSDDIDSFIKIRQKQFSPMGFLITGEMKMLWKNFYPKKCDLLLAATSDGHFVSGIQILYYKDYAYYWFASSRPEGKKLFAPTLLVWEAVKTAKKRGAKILDFEGVFDERFPKASEAWRGFTKFKEGFSDKKIIFMENFSYKKGLFS